MAVSKEILWLSVLLSHLLTGIVGLWFDPSSILWWIIVAASAATIFGTGRLLLYRNGCGTESGSGVKGVDRSA
jgi:hypothetical protein